MNRPCTRTAPFFSLLLLLCAVGGCASDKTTIAKA
jgi:hypothetical protein